MRHFVAFFLAFRLEEWGCYDADPGLSNKGKRKKKKEREN